MLASLGVNKLFSGLPQSRETANLPPTDHLMTKKTSTNKLLRALPAVDSILKTAGAITVAEEIGPTRVTSLARQVTADLRQELLGQSEAGADEDIRSGLLKRAEQRLLQLHQAQKAAGLRRVINATGVILHTNLGRAPLSEAAVRAITNAAGYCTLEYDLAAGMRGGRGVKVENLLIELTGAEAALVVNNCAAAALLVLRTLAGDGETLVSRGELVEIGGDFRVPDVMSQSGTRMVEVGTTNRTSLKDYENALSAATRLVMKVHTSNYRIIGFTRTPSLSDLAGVAQRAGIPLYEDAGSGALIDLSRHGIQGEPVIGESLASGVDIVTFSGDKLLGGPQSGIIVGRREFIDRMRLNPLYRALRSDKLRLAALEATLEEYIRGQKVPAQQMLALSADEIRERAEALAGKIKGKTTSDLSIKTISGESAVGGGSAPTSPLPTMLISVSSSRRTANEIETALRRSVPPIIVRIEEGLVLIDLRTVSRDEEPEIEQALMAL